MGQCGAWTRALSGSLSAEWEGGIKNMVQATTSHGFFKMIFVGPPAGHNKKKERKHGGVYVVVHTKNSI